MERGLETRRPGQMSPHPDARRRTPGPSICTRRHAARRGLGIPFGLALLLAAGCSAPGGPVHELPQVSSLPTVHVPSGTAMPPAPESPRLDDALSLNRGPNEVGADLHYHAARVYESKNDIPAALMHYEKALEKAPRDAKIPLAVARMYDRHGDLQHAQQFYQQGLQLAPRDVGALNDLGLCYAKQGRLEEAVESLSQAAGLRPREKRFRNNLAAVLVEAGRADEAYRHLAEAHGAAVAHYNTAFLLSRGGQTEAARQHLALALKQNPSLEAARVLLQRLDGGPAMPHGQTALPVAAPR